jgi:LytS/YehU family sensor histidine kinase
VYTTNLPSLLWQPLLENAVKHGVAPLQQKGQITVRVEKEKEGLIIQISDNGKGMVVQESIHGFGLKLTRERIALLNQLNQEQPIALAIDSQLSKGTEATLTFNHWFL